ncbi:hypothetical protein N7528_007472 [Penicillium herquei]|nr:hypothetical protein N7528_007472 [Penicillium herquei]
MIRPQSAGAEAEEESQDDSTEAPKQKSKQDLESEPKEQPACSSAYLAQSKSQRWKFLSLVDRNLAWGRRLIKRPWDVPVVE